LNEAEIRTPLSEGFDSFSAGAGRSYHLQEFNSIFLAPICGC
jgi:hypothetical protein